MTKNNKDFDALKAEVDLKLLVYMNNLFCCGTCKIPTALYVRLVCGYGTGSFLEYNDRYFSAPRAEEYLSILRGEHPKLKWNMLQSSLMHMMIAKDLPSLHSLMKPSGISLQEFESLPPSRIGNLLKKLVPFRFVPSVS
jgi:hypothetical protein